MILLPPHKAPPRNSTISGIRFQHANFQGKLSEYSRDYTRSFLTSVCHLVFKVNSCGSTSFHALLNIRPLHEYAMFCLPLHRAIDTWVVSRSSLFPNNVALHVLSWGRFISVGHRSRSGIAGSLRYSGFNSRNGQTVFQTSYTILHSTSHHEGSQRSTSLPTLVIARILDYSPPTAGKSWLLTLASICISLMAKGAEHLFM